MADRMLEFNTRELEYFALFSSKKIKFYNIPIKSKEKEREKIGV